MGHLVSQESLKKHLMEKNHNDRWAYWVLLIMFIALAIILIRRNKHADYVFENGQITTCQALHKYWLPATLNSGPSYNVIINFVWDSGCCCWCKRGFLTWIPGHLTVVTVVPKNIKYFFVYLCDGPSLI